MRLIRTGHSVLSLTRLKLTQYRNYTEANLAPKAGFVVLTGENGAGKTNILEAVSLLVPGRGLRGAALTDMAQQTGAGGFSVSAQLGDVQLGVGTIATAPERRLVRINGAAASANALSEWLSIVWLTPAMDRLFMEGASERRRFLDRLVLALTPSHAHHTARYEAAMRQRNRLLSVEGVPDADWLNALEAQMVEHGLAIAEARLQLIQALGERLADAPESVFARAAVAQEGWMQADAALYAQDLRQGRARDAGAGRTLAGPHRTDLAVTHVAKGQAAARCSTGEQKALLLSLILAHADLVAEKVQRRPILLLDEVAAHLDPTRRAALFERLSVGGGQVWMTGTEAELFSGLGNAASWFEVHEGKVQQN